LHFFRKWDRIRIKKIPDKNFKKIKIKKRNNSREEGGRRKEEGGRRRKEEGGRRRKEEGGRDLGSISLLSKNSHSQLQLQN
jgi:hypothetical protein